jgi:hypothetical protein
MRSATSLLRVKAVLALVGAVLCTSITQPARADETVRAVWQVQDLYLSYFGLTTHYSCDGIRERMRAILKELSVREDFLVTMAGCIELTGPTYNPTVRMIVANAIPATDEVTKAFATDPKRAELLARLQKKSKTPFTDEPFDAYMKRVTLHSKAQFSSGVGESGDCELLEQMRRTILPKLGAKVSNDFVYCTPHQGNVGNPSMDVDLLVPVPAAKT